MHCVGVMNNYNTEIITEVSLTNSRENLYKQTGMISDFGGETTGIVN